MARHAHFLLKRHLRTLMIACAGSALLAANAAHAENPAVVIPTAPIISPASALSYYGSPASPTPPANRDPIVAEAARALRYDVDTIYAYVRDNIRLTPMFGLQKGARGVILDGYGSAFDQAQFMVDTLREADAVSAKGYNPAYKLGTISLTAAQFSAWTGVTDASVATKFLANGGIPATVTGSGSSFTVSMLHVWVQVTISGTDYLFDPSFKPSTSIAALPWQSQTGYNQATLLSSGGGATATTVNGFNITNFRAKLAEYRASLEGYLATNAAGKRAEAVVGDDVITAHGTTEDRRTSLPYVSSTDRSWSGQIPDIFRTSFTVKLNGSAYGTYYADVDGGEILGFSYSYSGGAFIKGGQIPSPVIASTFLDPCDQWLSNKSTAASPAVASVDINHPYAANSGGYADRTISRQIVSQVCSAGRFFISNDWGYTGNGASQRMAPIAAQIRSDPTRTTDFTFGPTVANIASQYSSFLDLAGKAHSSVFQLHDLIGIHVLDNVAFSLAYPGATQYSLATAPSMSFEASVSAVGKAGSTASDVTAAFSAGLGLSYAEGAVPRQETDSVYDMAALSLVTQQDTRATTPGTYSTYLANPSASPAWSTVQSSLSGYPASATSAASSYVSEGYSLLIPQRGALRQPPISVEIASTGYYRVGSMAEGSGPGSSVAEITRSAFLAWRPSSGSGSVPDRIALVLYDRRRGSMLKAAVGVPIQTGADASPVRKPDAPKVESKDFIRAALSVDGRSGALSYAPAPDLTDGAGDFPRSLSLQRVYAQQDQTNYGFGMGWKSNWYQVATLSNDGQLALGNGGAQAVASALVAIQAMGDLTTIQDAQHLYAALQTASWLTDQTINNSIVVSRGLDPDHAFYQQASGGYVSAKADGATLSMSGSPSVGIINRRVYLDTNFSFTDRDGSIRTYPNLSATPIDISSPGIASAYTRKFIYMDQWAFPNGIKVNTAYSSTLQADVYYLFRASNNLGASIKSLDYDFGSATDFPYCKVNGGVVYYKDPWPASISYKTPSRQATFNMDAQVGWQLTVDPDGARCAAGTMTPPMRQLQYVSYLRNAVDPANNVWPVGYASVGGMFGDTVGLGQIYKPSNTASPDIAITYGNDGNVRSFTNLRNNSWTYYSSTFRSESVSPLQAASPGRGNAVYYDQYGQAVRSVDPLLRATTTSYDTAGRPLLVTQPEGNAMLSAYDARGNVVSQTQKAKPGTGLADLVTSTTYAEGVGVVTCTNIVTCNKPIRTIDPRGFRSDYGWDASTGMPLSVRQGWNSAGTACQISTGGGCPSVTFGYGSGLTGFDPFTGDPSGPIYLPQSQTEAVQSGTTTTSYGYTLKSFSSTYAPLSLQNVRKLVPTQVTVDNGGLNLVTCFDYDDAGNIISDRSPRGGGTCP